MKRSNVFASVAVSVCLALAANAAIAGPREQAFTMYQRLNGIPPSATKQAEIAALIEKGDLRGASMAAMDQQFYNVVLRDLFSPIVSETQQVRVEYNDVVATAIGMVRDGYPFDEILYGDVVYIFATPSEFTDPLTPYTVQNNDHYEDAENNRLRFDQYLERKKQSEFTSFLTPDVASGVYTMFRWAQEYYNAGTNRAAVRFTFMNFLCKDMEQVSDTSRPDFRVRQDVTRSPGGESSKFRNTCAGCHGLMDGLAGAFAYHDLSGNGSLLYDPRAVRDKYLRNSTEYPPGYQTIDDSWINLMTEGPNASFGWHGPAQGKGTKSLGKLIARSDQFAMCWAEKALKKVCGVTSETPEGKNAVNLLANELRANSRYNLKNTFGHAAVMCRGE